jgi:protein-disulfide isomerase
VRVERDFVSGIRAGVAGTPTAFVQGERVEGDVIEALRATAGR